MLFFLLQPILAYNWILILAAVIPAVILLVKVYKMDRLEKESPQLLWKLVRAGVLSTLLAMIEESIGQGILTRIYPEGGRMFNIWMYFVVVAISEETSKYIFMKMETWNNPEFNCQYDGVVYALFTSLGFALWENISYVLNFGFSTALVRAVTAIPGHASFGVFMGVFYGVAKKVERQGKEGLSKLLRVIGIAVAALLHGAYDFIATDTEQSGEGIFLVFVIILFAAAYIVATQAAKRDQRI